MPKSEGSQDCFLNSGSKPGKLMGPCSIHRVFVESLQASLPVVVRRSPARSQKKGLVPLQMLYDETKSGRVFLKVSEYGAP